MPRKVRIDQDASEERLEKLIAERTQPGADKAQIDARVWDLFGETWAIMFTDLAGFSRRVSDFGIIHFLARMWQRPARSSSRRPFARPSRISPPPSTGLLSSLSRLFRPAWRGRTV
jgi:hypothetical protein